MTRQRIPAPAPGRGITAVFLDTLEKRVYDLEPGQRAPRQVNGGSQQLTTGTEDTTTPTATAGETWTEVSRTETSERIYNPDDTDQYVDVTRITAVTFRRPDGTTVELRLTS